MLTPRQVLRMFRINWVLARRGLDEIIFTLHFLRPFRFLLFLAPWTWFRDTSLPRGARIRLALEDLGPIFVKFGQMLSTRRDLLPHDIAKELAHLQDRVPPYPGVEARGRIEKSLGAKIEDVFSEFEETPLASASIAQVHAATMHDGRKVIVKVLRPGIEKVIRRDIELLYFIAKLARRYWADGRRLRPVEVVAEYEKTILDELDLMREGANASELRRNFDGSELLYVPEVYWDWTRRDVMVMERIYGIPIRDLDALHAAGTNMQELSERGVEIFFTQVFRHNFFHADMHPGNIFVDVSNPQKPKYIAVDFGIVGTLDTDDQHYLAENFIAFFNRDYRRVAELHVESGWVPAGTRVDEFESAIRTVCEPIFNKPLKEISFGQLLLRLFQVARRFQMEVQPQLVLLQKTLLNIEGLGRDLYPDLDLWKTAKPFLENWMKEQLGPRHYFKRLKKDFPELAEAFREMPLLLRKTLRHAVDGTLEVQWKNEELTRLREEMSARRRSGLLGMTGGSLVISGAILLGLGVQPWWFGPAVTGAGLAILAAALLRR
ncbi:MAG: ubiquinone biosynthesis regulatory protein kinase UbiB [Gammaproteobacteria bacterium]|nr:ubiquinone biosynthesis regulatory protein kinase UbiB [Gammaproteobacteria bacterium]